MKAAYLTGNAIDLLQNGSEFFPALIAAIDAAEREFHLETYIFEDDATGRAVAGALCRAARRGVAVRVLADGFGAADFVATLRPQLEAAGVQVLVYRPEIARFRLRRHRLRRLHRKLAVADGRSAFVGGINIVDDIDAAHPAPPRFDYAVRVEGMRQADWVLIDAGDVIVHVFQPEVRAFYNLEKMWAPGTVAGRRAS